jgi:hypothetical protein
MIPASRTLSATLSTTNPQPPAVYQDKNKLRLALRIALIVGSILIGAAVSLAIGFALTTLTPITFVALPVAGAAVGLAIALTIIFKCSGKNAAEIETAEEVKKAEIETAEEVKKAEIETVEEVKKAEIETVEEVKKAGDAKTNDTEPNKAPITFQAAVDQYLKDGSLPSKEYMSKILKNEILKDCSPEGYVEIEAELAEIENSEPSHEFFVNVSEANIKQGQSFANKILAEEPELRLAKCLSILSRMAKIPGQEEVFNSFIRALAHQPGTEDIFTQLAGQNPEIVLSSTVKKKALVQYIVESLRNPEGIPIPLKADELLEKIIRANPTATEDEQIHLYHLEYEKEKKAFDNFQVNEFLQKKSEKLLIQLAKWPEIITQSIIQNCFHEDLPYTVKVQLLKVFIKLPKIYWEFPAGYGGGLLECRFRDQIKPIDVEFCHIIYKELSTDREALDKLMEVYPSLKQVFKNTKKT